MPGTKKNQMPDVLNNFGFTLIELVITLFIMSILVTLAVPNFNKIIGAYQLDISAREMASDIRDLQQEALKIQYSGFSVQWNITTEEYYLENGLMAIKTVQLPNGIDIDTTNFVAHKMFIKSNGRPNNFGTVTLKDSTTGKFKYVIVDTLGRVRVSDTFPTS